MIFCKSDRIVKITVLCLLASACLLYDTAWSRSGHVNILYLYYKLLIPGGGFAGTIKKLKRWETKCILGATASTALPTSASWMSRLNRDSHSRSVAAERMVIGAAEHGSNSRSE